MTSRDLINIGRVFYLLGKHTVLLTKSPQFNPLLLKQELDNVYLSYGAGRWEPLSELDIFTLFPSLVISQYD